MCGPGTCTSGQCVYCPTGYSYRFTAGVGYCDDINECALNLGKLCNGATGTGGTCTNRVGGFDCVCPHDYAQSVPNEACFDINECATGSYSCAPMTPVCTNRIGQPYSCVGAMDCGTLTGGCALGYTCATNPSIACKPSNCTLPPFLPPNVVAGGCTGPVNTDSSCTLACAPGTHLVSGSLTLTCLGANRPPTPLSYFYPMPYLNLSTAMQCQ